MIKFNDFKVEQPATPNPEGAGAAATEKNPKKLQKAGSSVEGEATAAADETSDGGAEASNSIQAAVNNEV